MKFNNVVVKESKIEGKGVFASHNFKKGEIVLQWDISHTLSKGEVDKISEEEKGKSIAFLNNKYIIQ